MNVSSHHKADPRNFSLNDRNRPIADAQRFCYHDANKPDSGHIHLNSCSEGDQYTQQTIEISLYASRTFMDLWTMLIKRQFLWISGLLVVLLLLIAVIVILEPLRLQTYEPVSMDIKPTSGIVTPPWPQNIHFSIGIICLDLPTWWIDMHEKGKCYINAWLRGSPPGFRFTNYEFILRDVEDNMRQLPQFSYEIKDAFVSSGAPWRSVDIVYEFSRPPKTLSLTVPSIEVAGAVYTIPELRFEYQETIGYGRFVNW